MDNISFIAISRQKTLRDQLDVVAQNVANVNTQGYKAENLRFREYIIKLRGGVNENIAYADNIGKLRDINDGPLQTTNNDLDVAIKGIGYFQVRTPQGVQYTRNGKFNINNQGILVDSKNQPVLSSESGVINLGESTRISIARDGTISDEQGLILGRIGLVNFANELDLDRTENNQFSTRQTPLPVVNPDVIQGSLEGSNVQPVIEITKLIRLQADHTLLKGLMDEEAGRQNKILETYSGKG